jgi:hypothetical protein
MSQDQKMPILVGPRSHDFDALESALSVVARFETFMANCIAFPFNGKPHTYHAVSY